MQTLKDLRARFTFLRQMSDLEGKTDHQPHLVSAGIENTDLMQRRLALYMANHAPYGCTVKFWGIGAYR